MNIDDFGKFFDSLEKKYDWTYLQWRPVRDLVDQLYVRQNDKKLYLGVVGEFSSGKSTLINALLHTNLLKEDILQGTTCAPTFLQYGTQFDVVVEYVNGNRQSLLEEFAADDDTSLLVPSDPRVHAFIERYTATEEFSSELKKVDIYIRNRILQNGLVIIDTPGVNAENERHSHVTEAVIHDYCDAALLIIPAASPCSQTLCNFIRAHLESIRDRCLGIITQIDRVRKNEQARQIQFVQKRLESETHTELSVVLPISARYALEDNENPELTVYYKQMFTMLETVIYDKLVKGRDNILNQKLQELLREQLLPQVDKVLKTRNDEFLQRKNALEQNKLVDLSSWLQTKRTEYFQRIKAHRDNWLTIIQEGRTQLLGFINTELNQAGTKEDVRAVATYRFPEFCKAVNDCAQNKVQLIREAYYREVETVAEEFQESFRNAYRDLNVSVRVNLEKTGALALVTSDSIMPESMNRLYDIDSAFSFEVFNQTEWGAKVGDFLMNNLGETVRYSVGRIINIFGDPTAMREQLRELLVKEANRWISSQLTPTINNSLKSSCEQAQKSISDYMDIFEQSHSTVIHNIITRERKKVDELQKRLRQTQNDLAQLNTFRDTL